MCRFIGTVNYYDTKSVLVVMLLISSFHVCVYKMYIDQAPIATRQQPTTPAVAAAAQATSQAPPTSQTTHTATATGRTGKLSTLVAGKSECANQIAEFKFSNISTRNNHVIS